MEDYKKEIEAELGGFPMVKMVQRAQEQLLQYPERSARSEAKRILHLLCGQKTMPIDHFNWPNGMLAKSLIDYYDVHQNSKEAREIQDCLKKFCDRFIHRKCKMYYLDDAISGLAAIKMHQITENEKYKQAADEIAKYLFQHETDDMGSLLYRPAQKNGYIFADMIGMVCPFLCKYGITYGNNTVINLAVTQIINFITYGMDEKTGLPYHGYELESGMKYGIIGWGRAVGWLMIGMSETLALLDEANPGYETIKQAYRRIVDKVEAYQLAGGWYTWQLTAKEGPVDTSATAMILYAISKSLDTKILIGIHKSRMLRGLEALQSIVTDGEIPNALAECQGFSLYPQVYGSYPWSLAPALSLFIMNEEPKEGTK